VLRIGETVTHEKSQHLIAEVPRRRARVEMNDRYRPWRCLEPLLMLNEKGEVADRGRFTQKTPSYVDGSSSGNPLHWVQVVSLTKHSFSH
jgi:hypothetical protein